MVEHLCLQQFDHQEKGMNVSTLMMEACHDGDDDSQSCPLHFLLVSIMRLEDRRRCPSTPFSKPTRWKPLLSLMTACGSSVDAHQDYFSQKSERE